MSITRNGMTSTCSTQHHVEFQDFPDTAELARHIDKMARGHGWSLVNVQYVPRQDDGRTMFKKLQFLISYERAS